MHGMQSLHISCYWLLNYYHLLRSLTVFDRRYLNISTVSLLPHYYLLKRNENQKGSFHQNILLENVLDKRMFQVC